MGNRIVNFEEAARRLRQESEAELLALSNELAAAESKEIHTRIVTMNAEEAEDYQRRCNKLAKLDGLIGSIQNMVSETAIVFQLLAEGAVTLTGDDYRNEQRRCIEVSELMKTLRYLLQDGDFRGV